jgi:uncharacterized repeat protein (TIGR01451 family)
MGAVRGLFVRGLTVFAVAGTIVAGLDSSFANAGQSTQSTNAAAHVAISSGTTKSTPTGQPFIMQGPNSGTHYAWALPNAAGSHPTATTAPQGPVSAQFTHTPAPGSQADLPPGNGSVMHSVTISLVYWLPNGNHFEATANRDTAFENLQQRWAQDAGGTPYYNLLTQYFDGSGHIANTVAFGASFVDTRAYPHAGTMTDPLTAGDLRDEVSHAVAVNHWTEDSTHITVVFTARDIQECDNINQDGGCTYTDTGIHVHAYCAYHSHFSDNGTDSIYAFMSNDDGSHGTSGCDANATPNNDLAADSEISTMSHEVIEAVTDPHPNDTWTDPDKNTGGEIGDKCNFNYAPENSIGADVYLHGHPYLVQQQWSNAVHTCAIDMCTVGGANNVCPPQVTGAETVDNDHPVIGDTIHYTVTVSNGSDTGAAANLTVNGPLPNGYQVTGVSAPGSSSQSSTATSFTVGYDTLAVHQTRTITVTATVPTQVGQSASACASITPQNLLSVTQPVVATSPCASTTPQKIPTSVTYTGPTTADYHDGFTASATVTGNGPVSGGAVTFSLAGAHCGPATTNGSGVAACGLTPVDAAGGYTLHADYAGDATHAASSTTAAFTITREETALAYTGPKHVANGVPATLSGVLTEDGTTPIAGRTVEIAIGTGTDRQACNAATAANGTVTCTIPVLNQPLNATATLPVSLAFTGDPFYLPSNAAATVRLEFYTGRSFGMSANVTVLLNLLTVPPTPDTGPIRVAKASTTTTPCTANVSLLLVLSADALCANVTTSLAPGTSTATATLADASIGIAGLPVIGVSGLTAKSVSTCTGTSGSTTLTLTIGGVPVTVPTAPNSVIGLSGGARLVVNEQTAVPGADFGTTVNGVHLVVPGLLGGTTADVVLGSATSDAHNCS